MGFVGVVGAPLKSNISDVGPRRGNFSVIGKTFPPPENVFAARWDIFATRETFPLSGKTFFDTEKHFRRPGKHPHYAENCSRDASNLIDFRSSVIGAYGLKFAVGAAIWAG